MKLHRINALLIKYFYIGTSVERMADIFFWPLVDVFVWGFLSHYLSDVIGKEIAFTFLLGVCFRPFELKRSTRFTSFYSRRLLVSKFI